MIGLFKAIGEALGLVRDLTDPVKKRKAINNYLTKKVIEDVKEAKLLVFHIDTFMDFILTKMGLKDKKDKPVLKRHFQLYKKLRKRFLL